MSVADSGLPADTALDPGLAGLAAFAAAPLDADEARRQSAHFALVEALATLFEALADPACGRLLGPLVPGAILAGGARVPGTPYEFEPCHAAFNLGVLLHQPPPASPRTSCSSASLAAILAVADYQSRQASMHARPGLLMEDVFAALIKTEILQTALLHSGVAGPGDPVLARLVADTAVATLLLGGNDWQIFSALAGIWAEHRAWLTPGCGGDPRSRLATGDAAGRAVRHALLALRDNGDGGAQGDKAKMVQAASHLGWRGSTPGAEAIGLTTSRLTAAVAPRLGQARAAALVAACADHRVLRYLPVDEFVALTIH